MLPPLDQIKAQIDSAVPGAHIEIVPNEAANQPSLLMNREAAFAIAKFLRDAPGLRLDYASNVTGVDFLDSVEKVKVKTRRIVDGAEQEIEEVIEQKRPGYLEAVYHLYSMELKHGPVILRMRTANRTDAVQLPSLVPVWRGAEFQEREIYDLYGVRFDGHPDLRRLLMWEGFQDHPMRKDYQPPDDFEYEPTPHDDVLKRAKLHYPARRSD